MTKKLFDCIIIEKSVKDVTILELIISGYGKEGQQNIIKCNEYGNVIWSDTIESPSFVCVNGNRMFAGTESDDYAIIHSYVKDGDGYRHIDSVRYDGTCLCHVGYSDKNKMVFGACWGSGHVLYAKIDDEGRFISSGSIMQENETGDKSLLSRAHFVHINKAQDTLMVTNVGIDVICFYEIGDGTIREKDRITTETGQHPRHAVYTEDEKTLYVITELSNEVLVYDMPSKTLRQRISTLPEGYSSKSHCSAICLSPDEKTVYGANRYSESIVFFGVDDNGILYNKGRISCHGNRPRHMSLTKDGKHLIICYQISGEVVILPIGEDGLPESDNFIKFDFHDAAGIAQIL